RPPSARRTARTRPFTTRTIELQLFPSGATTCPEEKDRSDEGVARAVSAACGKLANHRLDLSADNAGWGAVSRGIEVSMRRGAMAFISWVLLVWPAVDATLVPTRRTAPTTICRSEKQRFL